MTVRDDRVPIWNVWWTLTVLAAAFGVVVAVLEALGVFRDLGIALGMLSGIATIIFGVSASTRSPVRALDRRFIGVEGRLVGLDDRLVGVDARLARLDDRLVTVDQRLGGVLDGHRAANEVLVRVGPRPNPVPSTL